MLLPALFALIAATGDAKAHAIAVTVRDTADQPIRDASLILLDSRGKMYASARSSRTGMALMPRADSGTYMDGLLLIATKIGPRRGPP
jgi:hypothetical protein